MAKDLGDALVGVDFPTSPDFPRFQWYNGTKFTPSKHVTNFNIVNLIDYFGSADYIYNSLVIRDYDPTPPGKVHKGNNSGAVEDPFTEGNFQVKDNLGTSWTKASVIAAIEKAFSNVPLNPILQKSLANQTPAVVNQIAQAASNVSSKNTLPFLEDNNGDAKQLGYISNIYVNLNYLYEQGISKNTASNDPQNKNNISIRDYIQGIMRDVQNSLGNLTTFDIQVDNRNAIGRIIDINFTGDPSMKLFQLELHNTKSVVRDYKFSSKIFPEMGSIIAISAQDATGIGKLGYDNATLVAWNEGISDRLIPKKDFNSNILLSNPNNPNSPTSFLLPFLSKIYNYFQYINGIPVPDDFNYSYGGLDFAYRDFLSNLDRFDPQNRFKTIIPTELTITLDGIGGIIIGNLFKINQDVVPKGYKNVINRDIAYIVTNLGHQLEGNDWVTELKAYPVVFEKAQGKAVWKKWNNNQYPGSTILNVGKKRIVVGTSAGRSNGAGPIPPTVTAPSTTQKQKDAITAAMDSVFGTNPGALGLCARYTYTLGAEYIKALNGKTLNGTLIQGSGNADSTAYRNALANLGYKAIYNNKLTKQQVINKIDKGPWNIGDIIIYYDPSDPTNLRHTQIYTGGESQFSGGYLWASSYSDNYTYNFIYNNKANDNFQFYVFTLTP
jgi:hypothetical protein